MRRGKFATPSACTTRPVGQPFCSAWMQK